MQTTNYTNTDAVGITSACFPFIGSFKKIKIKLRQQHFKRKQHE